MPVRTEDAYFSGPSLETPLWRYSSLPKLLSLLVKNELYLPSLRVLRQEDPFEGTSTLASRRFADTLSKDEPAADQTLASQMSGMPREHLPGFKKAYIQRMSDGFGLADACFASCWHARSQESAALWKLYAETQAGVSIRSSAANLCGAINSEHDLMCFFVRYCDFENTSTDLSNILNAAFTKRDSYEHEHEVRLLYWDVPPVVGKVSGLAISCDPAKLIEEIVVSPYAADWMVDTVHEVVHRLNFEIPVRKSRLLDTSL